jgi:putative drug exporter of the RND superfamily
MHLSGRANWWLPGWLDRTLPHLSIEPAAAAALPGSARHASDRVPQPAGAARRHLAASEQEPN